MTTSIDKLYDIIKSEMTPQGQAQLREWHIEDGNGNTIEATNDDCSKCGIILTDDDMDRETGKCECCEEEQYLKKCDHGCGTILTIDTPIMCWSKGEEEKTLCSSCYYDNDYNEDDENEDNLESEDEEEEEEEEPPLMVWDGEMKESIVEVECRGCKTIYKDTQSWNDCVSAYPYEYPKKGFYWRENKECYKCYKKKL